MTLSADEFIRRFLLHVLPKGFHRIRHNHIDYNILVVEVDNFPQKIPQTRIDVSLGLGLIHTLDR
jgi:hypothetical protein